LAVAATLSALGVGCATQKPAQGPKETLDAYATALKAGRIEEAYSLLSDEAKKQLPYEAFARMVKENPEESATSPPLAVRPRSQSWCSQQSPPLCRAGQWRVDGSTIDLYSQASPEATVRAFIRAFENKRWDVLMRFVPDGKKEGLDAGKLKKAWEGEQKDELSRLTQALAAALPTAKFERIGERATMSYGAGGTVELLREHGAWKVEEFR
jgi:hypothetical protein